MCSYKLKICLKKVFIIIKLMLYLLFLKRNNWQINSNLQVEDKFLTNKLHLSHF